jgi:cobalt/nickel transport system ATP-binding protein
MRDATSLPAHLVARDVTFAYPDGTVALRSLDLAISRGRKVVVLGANGCGKSTLFLHFGGVLRPKSGEIVLDGETVRYDRAGLTHLRQKVGLVFQDPDSQLFASSVRQDISFGPLNLGWPEAKVREAVASAIEATQITDLADRPAHLLSYGQKKRVAIAGVLAMDPEVIVADEPTAGLDPEATARLVDLFDELNANGRTIVISTHDVELALAWADEVIVMRAGEVIRTGHPTVVFQDVVMLRTARLQQPIVLETYTHLCHMNLMPRDAEPPRNAADLAELINCNCTRIDVN